MVRFFFAFLFLGSIVLSCSNEFDFTAPQKEIPIAYSVLNYKDSVHYVRLERAFVSEDKSALEIAKIPDSLYFPSATVELIDASNTRYSLQMVDATLEGFPRNEGVFAETPNYVYKISQEELQLRGGDELELEISTGESSLGLVRSMARVVDSIAIRSPLQGGVMKIDPERDTRLSWRHVTPDNSSITYVLRLRFNYGEENPNTGLFEDRFFDMDLGSISGDDELKFNGLTFFNALVDNVDASLAVARTIGNVELTIMAGGEEITEAIRVESANSGITSSQEVPVYDNIENGLGLFSSRYILKEIFDLTGPTQELIRTSPETINLNFL